MTSSTAQHALHGVRWCLNNEEYARDVHNRRVAYKHVARRLLAGRGVVTMCEDWPDDPCLIPQRVFSLFGNTSMSPCLEVYT